MKSFLCSFHRLAFGLLLGASALAAADLAWKNLRADPAFTTADTAANKNGRLLVENRIKPIYLVPVDFSPVK